MRKIFFGLLFGWVFASSANAYSRLIVFGDSLSDIGNNQHVVLDSNTHFRHVGAPIVNRVDGRLGQLWPQFLVKNVNLKKIIPTQIKGLPKHSWDYAYASAMIPNQYTNDSGTYNGACTQNGKQTRVGYCVPGVLMQIHHYLKAQKIDKEALYVIWGGGNDFFNNIAFLYQWLLHPSKWGLLTKSLSNTPTSEYVSGVKLLERKGISPDHIWVINLPPVTYTPAARDFTKENPVLLFLMDHAVRLFNADLRVKLSIAHIGQVKKAHIVDVYDFMQALEANPLRFGFYDTHDECVDHPLAMKNACRGYMFYDRKHPTVWMHRWFGEYLSALILSRGGRE